MENVKLQVAVSQKRWEKTPSYMYLLITNKKSHIGFQMTWNLLILDDLKGQ